MNSARTLAMAIDGGGTKTTACLAVRDERGGATLIGEATTGPSNPAATLLGEAKQNIAAATAEARESAGAVQARLARIMIGLAGIEATNLRSELSSWAAEALNADEVILLTDVELLAYAGQTDQTVVVLISGTGSVAVARQVDGRLHRCGGRGYLIGDEGSGYWIGAEGLRRAISALDGVGQPSLLVDLIADGFGSRDPNVWTQRVYGAPHPRSLIAGTSRWVSEAANQQDNVAQEILDSAGCELANLVRAAVARSSADSNVFDLVLAGGVLVNSKTVRDSLTASLTRYQLVPRQTRIMEAPARQAALKCCMDS